MTKNMRMQVLDWHTPLSIPTFNQTVIISQVNEFSDGLFPELKEIGICSLYSQQSCLGLFLLMLIFCADCKFCVSNPGTLSWWLVKCFWRCKVGDENQIVYRSPQGFFQFLKKIPNCKFSQEAGRTFGNQSEIFLNIL